MLPAYALEALLAEGRTRPLPPIRCLRGGRSPTACTDAPPRLLLCRACLFQCALRLTTSAPQPPPAATQDLRDSYDRAERDALAYPAVPGIYDATDVGHELVFVAAAHR